MPSALAPASELTSALGSQPMGPGALTTRCLLSSAAATLAGSLRCPSPLPRPARLGWPRRFRRAARWLVLLGGGSSSPSDSSPSNSSLFDLPLPTAHGLPSCGALLGSWVARGARELSAAAHALIPAFAATAAARCLKPLVGAAAASTAAAEAGSQRASSALPCWLSLMGGAGLAVLAFLAAGTAPSGSATRRCTRGQNQRSAWAL
jgi:hypothetical protein